MTGQPGSAEANSALVLDSFEAFSAGDTERLLAIVAPDLVMHLAGVPEPLRGRETWRQGFELMRRAFPDLEARVDDVVAAGDRVAVRVGFGGTHEGEFQGIPPTGRTIRYASHEFYRVADGLIAEEWICADMASLFAQLS
ncbi:MAG TPA: ester cyclase [Gaiellaceae bacterium]|nr:ester cyclase [Gaiellaceae bacterium]